MKKRILGIITSVLVALSSTAQAQDVDHLCNAYAKGGRVLAATMLDATFAEVLNIISGKNPELLQKFTTELIKQFNGEELDAISRLNSEDSKLLFGMAGMDAMNIMIETQTTSLEDIQTTMYKKCKSQGSDVLIERMRKIEEIRQGNNNQ